MAVARFALDFGFAEPLPAGLEAARLEAAEAATVTLLEEVRFLEAGTVSTAVVLARFVLGFVFGLAAVTGFVVARSSTGSGAGVAFAPLRLATGLAFAERFRAGDSSTTSTGSAGFLDAVLLLETDSSNTGLAGRTIWT